MINDIINGFAIGIMVLIAYPILVNILCYICDFTEWLKE